ncbi:MAG: hypothetical protein ABSH22_20260 [Tepidisphaeraceae bacterium]|jgi:hypothetical protein
MNGALPLFNEDCPPDDWRHIRAPGGYEWRRFEAWTPSSVGTSPPLYCTIIFSQGWPLNAQYLRRYRSYRRHPTIHAPPQPAEFPAIFLRVRQGNRLLISDFVAADAGQFSVSDGASIQYGDSFLQRDADGCYQITLRPKSKTVTADLVFRATQGSLQKLKALACFPPPLLAGLHRWLITPTLFSVTGELRLNSQPLPFTGHGICDHQFGVTPLLPLRHWIRGLAPEPDRAILFQFASTTTGAQRASVIQIDPTGISELEAETFATEGRHFTSSGVCYPNVIRVAGRVYTNPTHIDHSPASITVQYQSQCQRPAKSPAETPSPLLCEIASPAILTRPALLSRFFPFPA